MGTKSPTSLSSNKQEAAEFIGGLFVHCLFSHAPFAAREAELCFEKIAVHHQMEFSAL